MNLVDRGFPPWEAILDKEMRGKGALALIIWDAFGVPGGDAPSAVAAPCVKSTRHDGKTGTHDARYRSARRPRASPRFLLTLDDQCLRGLDESLLANVSVPKVHECMQFVHALCVYLQFPIHERNGLLDDPERILAK